MFGAPFLLDLAMPKTVFVCPQCKKRIGVPERLVGRWIKCPGCSMEFAAMAEEVLTADSYEEYVPETSATRGSARTLAIALTMSGLLIALVIGGLAISAGMKHSKQDVTTRQSYQATPGQQHTVFDPTNFENTLDWAKWHQNNNYRKMSEVEGNDIMQEEIHKNINASLRTLLNQRVSWAIEVEGVSREDVTVVGRYFRKDEEAERERNFSPYCHLYLLKPDQKDWPKPEDFRRGSLAFSLPPTLGNVDYLDTLRIGTQISANDARKLKKGDKLPLKATVASISLTEATNVAIEIVLKDIQAGLP